MEKTPVGICQVRRLDGNPIIVPNMDGRMGDNINGPSLIRVPDWVANPLGRYYLYFAHHAGEYIRLAYAEALTGPWHVHEPGVMSVEASGFEKHVASPDAHVDHDAKEIRLYFHGMVKEEERSETEELPHYFYRHQRSRVAISQDGLRFDVRPELITAAYLRVFQWNNAYYGLTKPTLLYRSEDGLGGFQTGPMLIEPRVGTDGPYLTNVGAMRHHAVQIVGSTLRLFHTRIGDCPECLLMSTVDMSGDWREWRASEPEEILRAEHDWEGANYPCVPSAGSISHEPVNQLRDPAIFEEAGHTYLLYCVAGEKGIAIAELIESP